MNRIWAFVISILLCFTMVIEAQAIQVPVTLTIDEIPSGVNPYSVSPGGTFQWHVEYDQNLLTSNGLEFLTPWADTTLKVDATVGTYQFQISDAFYYPFYPALLFTNGVLDGFFMFNVLDSTTYVNYMGGNQYLLVDADYYPELNNYIYAGHFTFPSPVPEPMTFILVALGILGMPLFKRNYKRTR